jgi:hypothetical protein
MAGVPTNKCLHHREHALDAQSRTDLNCLRSPHCSLPFPLAIEGPVASMVQLGVKGRDSAQRLCVPSAAEDSGDLFSKSEFALTKVGGLGRAEEIL